MAYSPEQTDRIIKGIYPYLAELLTHRDIRKLGYFDFLELDAPETDHAASVACEAFLYMSLDNDSNWNENVDVLRAIITFLTEGTGRSPSKSQVSALWKLLQVRPVKDDQIRSWFDRVYR